MCNTKVNQRAFFKKKKQFQICNIRENSDKITLKIIKTAKNKEKACKVEYNV